MVRTALRYLSNMVTMVAQQHGYRAAFMVAWRFVIGELSKLPMLAFMLLSRRLLRGKASTFPRMYSETILTGLSELDVSMEPYEIDGAGFHTYIETQGFPRNYAGGPLNEGGFREQKLLEYYVSLDFLDVKPSDVVVDVGSEWALFPQKVRDSIGATVYQQDLVFEPGIHGTYIGGSAAQMPVPDGFADKIVLHNAYEHFEGSADSDFIGEAWRVLRPGGVLCILPLFMSDRFRILTDPLVNREGITWDDEALIVQVPLWRNRFGRVYDAAALQRRVLAPATACGFEATIYHVRNVKHVEPGSNLYFALLLRKPAVAEQAREGAVLAEREPVAAQHATMAGAAAS